MMSLDSAKKIHSSSWHEMHREATDLGLRLKDRGPWRGIVAISRGGLVPASVIARVLDIRLIVTICIASYDGEMKGELAVLRRPPPEIGSGEGWLLVDDVADSGATAAAARQMLPAAHYAALYVKPAGKPFVDTYLCEVEQGTWIDFPWDRDPAKPHTQSA
ncbi:MAG: xanthine phosphoribosyltransferase [Rhodospirillales bacterium]|jgi:xanthine phosphoribosyltransferase|nr:xanthine phosphoribosyltransferase [Rhodospirillales bacterium]